MYMESTIERYADGESFHGRISYTTKGKVRSTARVVGTCGYLWVSENAVCDKTLHKQLVASPTTTVSEGCPTI